MESGVKRMNETKFQTVLTIAYWASIGGLLYFLVRYLLVWTLPLFFGLAIAALTRPAALTLTKKTRLGEKSAAIISLLLFYLLAAALLGLFLTILLAQLYELLDRLPVLYAYGFLSALLYGLLLNGWYVIGFVQPFSWPAALVAFGAALPFDATHGVATVVFLAALYVPWRKKLERIKRKYALI